MNSIDINDLLRETNRGLDVFKYYLGPRFTGGKKHFKSPFYDDSKASCNIYFDNKSNRYKFKDFGENENPVDCFGFIGRLKSIDLNNKNNFHYLLKLINNDLSLGLEMKIDSEIPKQQKQNTNNEVILKPDDNQKSGNIIFQEFKKTELDYWFKYGIREDILSEYHVKSVKSFNGISSSKKNYTISSNSSQPIFAYCFNDYSKLYRPFSKLRFLFIGKKEIEYVFGLEQLPLKGDLLFITGGEKDVLSISARGLNAVCFNSETANISHKFLIEFYRRFNHIVLLYDCDKTGIKSMDSIISKNTQLKLIKVILPLSGKKNNKDISDFFYLGNSKESLFQLFVNELNKTYVNTINTLKTCEVNLNKPPIIQPPVLSIGESSIGSLGNIIGVTGTEGSGKSNFVAAVISGCLNPLKEDIDTLGVMIKDNVNSKAVVMFDTEQSIVQLHKNIDSVKRRAGISDLPEWFKAYSLVALNRKERFKTIVESIDKFYYEFSGIHIIVIDGIADLIGSVNDEEQSVELINKLFQMAQQYNTLIICVLHMNPSGVKLRGHLGSELQRKASSILSVDKFKDKDISIVKAVKLREGNPLSVPIIQFAWQDSIQQHEFIGFMEKGNFQSKKIKKLKTFAKQKFANNSIIQSSELGYYLMDHFDIKERMARNYIKLMRDNLIIRKESSMQNAYILVDASDK